jgi:hypothetical protein
MNNNLDISINNGNFIVETHDYSKDMKCILNGYNYLK